MIGIQLYTVRNQLTTPSDALNTLKKIKDIGYDAVQLFGGIETIELMGDLANKVGLKVIGALINIDICENYTERLFKALKACGAKDVGISGKETGDSAIKLVERANAFKKIAEDNGFTFSYHNHSHEYIRGESGKRAIDYIIDDFNGDLMPDTYWLQHGGDDVIKFIKDNAKRIKIIHLKDMKRTPEGVTFAEIGIGNINIKGVIETAKQLGIDTLVVEQDICEVDCLLSAKISIDNLKKII